MISAYTYIVNIFIGLSYSSSSNNASGRTLLVVMLRNEKLTFNLQYGRAALEAVMKSILRHETPVVSPPSTYKGNFFDGKNIY